MFDFDSLRAEQSVKYVNDSGEWSFRKLDCLKACEAVSINERKDDMTVAQLLVELAAADGCEITEDDVMTGLSSAEIRCLTNELSKPVSLGE